MSRSITRSLAVAAGACLAIGVCAPSAASAQKLFLSNGRDVAVFRIDNGSPGSPIASLSTTSAGALAEAHGRLYVAQPMLGTIGVYDTTTLRHVATLQNHGLAATSLAVGPDGTLYAGSGSFTNGRAAGITVFAPGSRQPTRMLSCARAFAIEGLAVNGRGDVFVNQNRTEYGSPEVDVFPHGSTQCRALPVNEYYGAGGLSVDPRNGTLLVADAGYSEIFLVPPPYTAIAQVIALPRCIGERVWNLTLDPATSMLYISDPTNGADALSFPSGGRVATYEMSSATGIAIER